MPENQTTQRLAEILSRIKQLPSANLEPPQFFANFLQLTVAATGSRGGAIWLTQAREGPQCYCHIDLEACGIGESDQQKHLIVEAVQRTVAEGKPLVISPAGGGDPAESVTVEGETPNQAASANQSRHALFFVPLKAAQQVAMVLQVIGVEGLSAHDYRTIVGLLMQIVETGDTYLAHRRAAVLDDDRKSLARLLQYAEGVHGSLDPEKVVYQAANLGRDAIGCTRLVIWIDPKVKRRLVAVSGVDKADRRAVLLQTLEKLSRHCLELKKPIVAAREQLVELSEEEELTELLKDYFNVSKLDQIFLQPIKNQEDYLGVLIAEGFDEQSGVNLAGIIATVAKHTAVALNNALEMAAVPLVRPLGKLQKVKKDPKKRRKWLIILTVLAVGLVICMLLPWTIRIECACRLAPRDRRIIDVPLDGMKIAEIIRTEGVVQQGELMVQLDDEELWSKWRELKAQRDEKDIQYNQAIRSERRDDQELFHQELEILNASLELLDLLIDKCKISAPIGGTILTPQLKMKTGKTVSRGEQICEIADLDHWQLVLEVPQQEMGWVQRALEEQGTTSAKFILEMFPEYRLQAEITKFGQISQIPQITEEGNVYEIRVDVADEQFEIRAGDADDQVINLKTALRDDSLGRAKIDTLDRPLGYVLLRKVIRFFRVTFF
ncbi:MAG: hypothetical protein AMJ79_05655 [Phycisphaerae bacterium SM23_30]|nr:MAG: hypothetical protein AMJ79_05655 [Phycisphaerae bacterium SM23_30]